MITTQIKNNTIQNHQNGQPAKRLGFKKIETAEIVGSLRSTLASYQIFFHKLQNFHWNIIGDDFYDIHEITETLYKESLENIDEIAERIRVFGQFPKVRLSQYLRNSMIQESEYDKSSEFMIRDLISDIEKLTECLLGIHENAASHGDIGTIHMCGRIVKDLETYHWQLTAWSNRKYRS